MQSYEILKSQNALVNSTFYELPSNWHADLTRNQARSVMHFKFSILQLRSITGYVTSDQQQSFNIKTFIARIIIIIIILNLLSSISHQVSIFC
jgi:hypothetical protein